MKAIRFYGKHDVRIEDVDEPGTIADDEVLVRSTYCGICGTDLHEYTEGPIWTSATPNSFSGSALPQILGHEFAGRVEAVGRSVTTLRPGDRVSIQPQSAPGTAISAAGTWPFSAAAAPPSGSVGPGGEWASLRLSKTIMQSNCRMT